MSTRPPPSVLAYDDEVGDDVTDSKALVDKLWNYCNVLRDDGLSYGDYVEQLTYVVVKRTAKLVTLQDECGDVKRVGVRTFRNVEACSPDGTYSLAPVLFAGAL